jgi:hypothetical protein
MIMRLNETTPVLPDRGSDHQLCRMSINILPVAKQAGPNPPGLVLVLAIFADTVIGMEEIVPSGVLSKNPVLLDGSDVYAFFTADLGAGYDQASKDGPAGMVYDHQVSVNYVSPEDLADPIFRKFKNSEFVLLCTNMYGRRHLVGTREQPLKCSIKKSTGSDNGMYGYKLDFSGQTYFPAPRFTGDFAAGQIIQPPSVDTMIDFSEFDFTNIDFY